MTDELYIMTTVDFAVLLLVSLVVIGIIASACAVVIDLIERIKKK